MFAPHVYIERRNKLKKALNSGLALFIGHDDTPINYAANVYPFRQDSSFLYFFGLDQPGLSAVLDLDQDRETIFGLDPTTEEIMWTGPRETLVDRAARAGVGSMAAPEDLAVILAQAQTAGRSIHYLPPYRAAIQDRLGQVLNQPLARIKEGASLDFIKAVIRLRAVKSSEEVAEIEGAVTLSRQTQLRVMEMARPGRSEAELMAAMMEIGLASGKQPAFSPLISVQGHILHPSSYDRILQNGDLLLNDSGFESSMRYASDITRIVPVSGRFTTRQKEIYQIVLQAQAVALQAIKPGIPFRDVHLLTCRRLVLGLKDLGLMKGDPDEAVATGAHALFFPCGLGHMMGLDVHDMEDLGEDLVGYDQTGQRSQQFGLKFLRLARSLEPGYVLTVEPGLYFIPHLIDLWKNERRHEAFIDYHRVEDFRDFTGLRVEDDILVTNDGAQILGPPIPKTVEEIEAVTS